MKTSQTEHRDLLKLVEEYIQAREKRNAGLKALAAILLVGSIGLAQILIFLPEGLLDVQALFWRAIIALGLASLAFGIVVYIFVRS